MLGSGDSLYDIGLDSGADLFDWCKVWLKVDVGMWDMRFCERMGEWNGMFEQR